MYRYRREDLEKVQLCNDICNIEDKIARIDHGVILPVKNNLGGVLDENGHFLDESRYVGDWVKIGGYYKSDVIKDRKEKVIYLGFFLKHWGHFLIDSIGRLWIFNEKEYRNYKFVYLLEDDDKKVDGNYKQFLELMGINIDNMIFINEPTRFREVLIPSLSTNDHYGYSNGYKKIFENVVKSINADDVKVPPKIYLSRTKMIGIEKKELGEKEIEKNFKNNGYQIFYPEELSLKTQIAFFQNAEEIVCVNGTIPLGIVFAKKTLRLVVLNKTSLIHYNLLMMSEVAQISPIYIDVYREPIKYHPRYLGEGPFWIENNENLKKYFSDNHLEYREYRKNKYIMYIKYLYIYVKGKTKNMIKEILKNVHIDCFY